MDKPRNLGAATLGQGRYKAAKPRYKDGAPVALADPSCNDGVAVKELKLSYHNGYI